ncbi:MAG: hypothetical protein WCN21_13320, partial [Comamonadaceae bacterium]
INGTLYCNDGDWVESRTALVEHLDGSLALLHWPALQGKGAAAVPMAVAVTPNVQIVIPDLIRDPVHATTGLRVKPAMTKSGMQ